MSEQGTRRPLLLAATGVVATVVLFLAYRRYTQASITAGSSLHRSNALRRSRRRWRRGFAPRELDRNPLEQAIQNLQKRIEDAQPYGRYNNRLLFTAGETHFEHGLFDLLPANLTPIYTILTRVQSLTDLEKDKLRFHIHSLFVQNFLHEEFPSGWIIGEDVDTLAQELGNHGIDEDCIRMMIHYFDHGKPLLRDNWDLSDEPTPSGSGNLAQSDRALESASAHQAIETLVGPARGDGSDESSSSEDDESDPGGSQNMLDLLYHIASEQAKREGFIHRGVRCNSCGITPIQGVRYHCANCYDYDLCEDCEAQQVHNKSHVFYKVRIPAPSRGHLKKVAPVWYPGQPNAFPNTMPRELQRRLVEEGGMDKTEMDACYEQFKCLAGEQIPIEDDPARIGMAISRKNFDMFFTPTSADRPPPPNLIHDRIFAFYDFHNDGVITLDEYILGLSTIVNKSRGARLKRMFMGYDLDADGFVDRKDFLRMFRAYYALNKEINREMIALQDDLDDEIRDVVQGSQPISAAFSGHYFVGHASRAGQDKQVNADGDLVISDGPNSVLQHDSEMAGDRTRAIGNAAVRDRAQTHGMRSFRQQPEPDEQLLYVPLVANRHHQSLFVSTPEEVDDEDLVGPDPLLHIYGWPPPEAPEIEDVVNALGADIPLDDVTDPVDRSRVLYAQVQRLDEKSDRDLEDQRAEAVREVWRRRQFYLDEEEGLSRPPGYREPDSSDDESASMDEKPRTAPQTSSSRRQSLRSRSSSKVRFDDSTFDTDHETRSNTSSRSIPVNERWGGFELSAAERDVGKEILYQAVQQGFNELLDPLFKRKEDEAMEAISTKLKRIKWSKELDQYEAELRRKASEKTEALKEADLLRTQALFSNSIDATVNAVSDSQQEPLAPPSMDQAADMEVHVVSADIDNKPRHSPNSSVSAAESASFIVATEAVDSTLPQHMPNDSTEALDPTLPQHMPNDSSFIRKAELPSQPSLIDAESDPSPPPFPESTLEVWLQHRRVDEEAHKRGGYGRLSYREFCRLMIQEMNGEDSDGTRQAPRIRNPLTGQEEADEDGAEEYEKMWSSNGDLGKMSFCGTWLELAQF